MIQFYAPDITLSGILPESDSQHCIRVLRMSAGEKVEVVDGKGKRYVCEIVIPDPRKTKVEILSEESVPLPWKQEIIVAVAPTKHMDRMEWLVEKLTETGVNRIIPILCRRSERKDIKVERLEKIAVSAMKQSLKAYLPKIDGITPVKDVLKGYDGFNKFIGYCDETIERIDLSSAYKPYQPTIVMIGPEGDFSPDEIDLSMEYGWTPVILSESRLRTETAALVAVDTIHVIDSYCKRDKK